MVDKVDINASASGTEIPLKKMDGNEEDKAVEAPDGEKTLQPVPFHKLFW